MKRTRTLFVLLISLVLFVPYGQAKTSAQLRNATVLIIRHAEKPESGKHLSPEGKERARRYVEYFKSLKIDSHPVKIDHLFAAEESVHSNRSFETLVPLSYALNLKIHSTFSSEEPERLADKVIGSYGGETVLICWHHGAIDELLKALGAHPKRNLPDGKWPEDVFGWLIVLRYNQQGEISASVLNEQLMADDKEHSPPAH